MRFIFHLRCIHSSLFFLEPFRSSPKNERHVSEHSCRLQGRECAQASLHKSSISSLSSLPPSSAAPPPLHTHPPTLPRSPPLEDDQFSGRPFA